MTRLLIALFVALGFGFVMSGPVSAQNLNCSDFQFQEEAQAQYEADTNDPNGLDGPPGPTSSGVPGVACENLPSRGASGEAPAPAAPVTDTGSTTTMQATLPDTGAGTMVASSSTSLVALLAALGMLSLTVATRRTVRR